MLEFISRQEQDTTLVKSIQLPIESTVESSKSIQISKKTIEISSLNSFIESKRINYPVKKAVPVIKTIPFVSQNDSVQYPIYNTFTGEFDFPKEHLGWDIFGFTPIKPIEAETIGLQSKRKKVETTIKKQITVEVFSGKDNSITQGFGSTDWMLGIIILAFVLFGWINVRFSRFVSSIIGASYNYFVARRLQEEGNVVRSKVFFVMNILFFINAALIITQWFEFNQYEILGQKGIVLFLMFLTTIAVVYSLKSLFLLLLDFMFLTKGAFMSYNSTVFIYYKIAGFILLPIIAFVPFVSTNLSFWLFVIALFMFGVLYLMRLLRGIQIGIKNRLSILYLILYLCALEILPMLILYHTIEQYI